MPIRENLIIPDYEQKDKQIRTAPDPAPFDIDTQFDQWNSAKPIEETDINKSVMSNILSDISRPFVATGYKAAEGVNKGLAAFATHLDSISEFVEKSTGFKKGGLFEKLADNYSGNSEHWKKRAEDVGFTFFEEIVGEAIGQAPSGITQFALDVGSGFTFPYMDGANVAAENGNDPFTNGLVEAAKTGTLDFIFRAMAPLKQYLKAPIMGTIFGLEETQNVQEGEKGKAFVKGLVTGAGYSLSSPGGQLGLNEIRQNVIEPKLSKALREKANIRRNDDGSINIGEVNTESIYQSTINRFASIENLDKRAKALGLDIPAGEAPGLRARNYLGVSEKVQSVLEKGPYKMSKEGNATVTNEGLKPIIKDYDTLSPEPKLEARNKDLNDFLIARRTIEDLQRPKREGSEENIVTEAQVESARKKITELEGKYGNIDHLETTATRLYDYQKELLHMLVDSGNLSEAQYTDIVTANPNYVPFSRILEGNEINVSGGPRQKKTFTETRSPVKRIKGSEKEIEDVMGSIIKNTYRTVDIAERNTVAKSVASLSDIFPDTIKRVRPKMQPINVTEAEVGRDVTIFRPSPFKPSGNVIEYYDNGGKKYIEVSENLYKSMSDMTSMSSDFLTRILSTPAHMLKMGTTSTPEFVLRNFVRDQFDAYIQTQVGFRPAIDSAQALADVIGKTDVYYDWLRSGGAHSTFVDLSRKNLNNIITKLQGEGSNLKYLNIINDAQQVSLAIEKATRLGVYKSAIRSGKSQVEAGFISREGTVDFASKGSSKSLQKFSSMTAFFNPAIQGTDRFIRAHKTNPKEVTMKATATITIPSVMLWMLNKDDPDYKELPTYQKDLFWNIKVGGPDDFIQWARVPKPFLYGQVYGSTVERFLNYVYEKDQTALDGFVESLISASTPIQGDVSGSILPTAIKPLIENETNWSFFRETPIVSESSERFLPYHEYGKYTTESAKIIGKLTNTSPSKIENFVKGYGGSVGGYSLEATDLALRALNVTPDKRRPYEAADLPLVKGFVSRPVESNPQSLREFYRRSNEISEAYATYKKEISDMNQKEQNELLKNYPELIFYPSTQSTREAISDINRQIDIVIELNISSEKKRKVISNLERLRLKTAQMELQLLNNLDEVIK
jgi:hypothetical protein